MIYLIRYGEIALKKGNRAFFERLLLSSIQKKIPTAQIKKEQGRILLEENNVDSDEVVAILTAIPGIHSLSIVTACKSEKDDIIAAWFKLIASFSNLLANKAFRCETRRVDKKFPINSDAFSALLGEQILKEYDGLHMHVSLKNQHYTFFTEIREKLTYIFTNKIKGVGGLPIGASGKALSLLSGGIDSPVASYLAMKRGMSVDFIYFHSYPFTPNETKEKILSIVKHLSKFQFSSQVFVVNFTQIQTEIRKKSSLNYFTILMRRAMMAMSSKIAKLYHYNCLITGEVLGQVASQTIQALDCTDKASDTLIIRPLITYDKEEVIAISRQIGTFEISILPYEDCCTVFVPSSPVIKPEENKVMVEEQRWYNEDLIKKGIEEVEILNEI